MKYLNTVALALTLVGVLAFTSCSKKDDSVFIGPSKVIRAIDVFSGLSDVYQKESVYRFIYSDNKLMKIEVDQPIAEISYTYYSPDSLSYSQVETIDGSTQWNKISAKLKDGKIKTCHSSVIGFMTYSYENNQITTVIAGANAVLDYEWDKDHLKITSIGAPYNGYYNTSYILSGVRNEYSIDLNILSQLIDERENYVGVMNSYGQMIDVVGMKRPYLLENTDYAYDYEYDVDGRLSSVTLSPKKITPSAKSYSFKIRYQ